MEWINEWINPAAMVLALVVGFCIKAGTKNEAVLRWIPTICALVGIAVVVATDAIAGEFKVYSIVIGAMSGLAATGLFEMVAKWLEGGGKDQDSTDETDVHGDHIKAGGTD